MSDELCCLSLLVLFFVGNGILGVLRNITTQKGVTYIYTASGTPGIGTTTRIIRTDGEITAGDKNYHWDED